ncbi:hypothetical protein QFZ63_007118 [Streptomyces sp. B3I7]|nr:hypothetical protein [Streptomyces sp. B3I7]
MCGAGVGVGVAQGGSVQSRTGSLRRVTSRPDAVRTVTSWTPGGPGTTGRGSRSKVPAPMCARGSAGSAPTSSRVTAAARSPCRAGDRSGWVAGSSRWNQLMNSSTNAFMESASLCSGERGKRATRPCAPTKAITAARSADTRRLTPAAAQRAKPAISRSITSCSGPVCRSRSPLRPPPATMTGLRKPSGVEVHVPDLRQAAAAHGADEVALSYDVEPSAARAPPEHQLMGESGGCSSPTSPRARATSGQETVSWQYPVEWLLTSLTTRRPAPRTKPISPALSTLAPPAQATCSLRHGAGRSTPSMPNTKVNGSAGSAADRSPIQSLNRAAVLIRPPLLPPSGRTAPIRRAHACAHRIWGGVGADGDVVPVVGPVGDPMAPARLLLCVGFGGTAAGAAGLGDPPGVGCVVVCWVRSGASRNGAGQGLSEPHLFASCRGVGAGLVTCANTGGG